jgi:hypothetical protein
MAFVADLSRAASRGIARHRAARRPGGEMKLFHCIVVMGAAMGAGCGGGEKAVVPDRDAGGPSPDAGSSPDAACAEAGALATAPGCFYSGGCSGTPAAPLGPLDCAHPQQLQCDIVGSPCTCDNGAPLAPTDCAATAQFQCVDWTLPCDCRCVPSAPPSPAACGCEAGAPDDAAVACFQGIWVCHSYEPPVGCVCSVPIL